MNDKLKTDFSSKIAQLTRIVFILNEQNNENEALIERIISEEEKEHKEEIIKLLNQINYYKNEIKKLEKSYEEKLDNFKLEIEYKYNKSLEKIQKEFDKFKNDKININEEIKYEFDLKVNSMRNQLKNLKDN